ncbi:SMI1/KNR4 family protein [Stenotrophomonas rhizophila]|uniref:SMI1/KNR4 family protein n=1 Tax=Stenotrophomonas rhizophila TaxID=216778 RepID=UPI001E563563|nr:SMI1/KNR4 family protein [Stenotrophomonas rhizophila]
MDMIALDIMTGDGDLYGLPANDSEIESAEQTLGVKLNADYIQFIKAFGGAFGGIETHAFNNGSLIGNATATELTERFRDAYLDSAGEQRRGAYVISDDGAGNPVLMTAERGPSSVSPQDWKNRVVV